MEIPENLNEFSSITDNELDNIILRIKAKQPYTGESLVQGFLLNMGYHIQRNKIRSSIHRVDSIGPAVRCTNLTEGLTVLQGQIHFGIMMVLPFNKKFFY